MTVVFGFPSAEHVTITAGVPFSSTGRNSDGRRVIGISWLHRWDEARPRTWARRLQINLEDLEIDGQGRRRHKCLQQVFRRLREHGLHALCPTTAEAIRDVEVAALCPTMAQVVALELVGLV